VDLSIVTRQLPGDVVEISPSGEIDLENANLLREAIGACLVDARPKLIRVDFRQVLFIDSVAVGALVAGHQTAAVSGARLVVTNPSEFVYRTLYMCGLIGLLGAPRPRLPDAVAADESEPAGERIR
jgi:anti-sigma B factor antagonist